MNLNKESSYLLGVYMGDGSIWNNGNGTLVFGLMVVDKDFCEEVARCIGNLTGKIPTIRTTSKPNRKRIYYRCQTTDKELIDFLIKNTHSKTIIPKIVLDAPLELKKEFIAGILDSEGYVSLSKRHMYGQFDIFDMQIGVNVQDPWLFEFRDMLIKMGVNCRAIHREEAPHVKSKVMFRFCFDKRSFIENSLYFKINRKQSRIEYYKSLFPSSTTTRRIPKTDEHKLKISKALTGRSFTEEHKNHLSIARKKWIEEHDDIVRDQFGRFVRR